MAESISLDLACEAGTLAAAGLFAATILADPPPRCVVYLHGDLGAGKTTFARGLLTGLGHAGPVPSPTYTLVETYIASTVSVVHADLYRLSDPAEVEFLALDEAGEPPAIMLVEWPQRGRGYVEAPDLEVLLEPDAGGRRLCATAASSVGARLLEELRANLQDLKLDYRQLT